MDTSEAIKYLCWNFLRKQPPKVFCKKRCLPATLLKKRLWHRCFPVSFVKFLRTPFLRNAFGRLLLKRATELVKKNNCILWKIFPYSDHTKILQLNSYSIDKPQQIWDYLERRQSQKKISPWSQDDKLHFKFGFLVFTGSEVSRRLEIGNTFF